MSTTEDPPVKASAGAVIPTLERPLGDGGSPQVEREFTIKARSQSRMVVRRFLHHRLAMVSLLVFVGLILLALVGGKFWHYTYRFESNDLSQGPSLRHPFGTNNLGVDEFALVLRGANKSVVIALMVAFLSTTFGTMVGAIAGFYRGFFETVLMRFVDLFLTVPGVAVAGVLAFRWSGKSNSWVYLAGVLAALAWMPIARVIRGVFLPLREKEFVEAARALGATNRRIIFRHLLPNAMGPIIVNTTLAVAIAILAEAGLSFLGLGIQPPDTSLGLLVSDGVQAATARPWLFYFPGLFLIVIVLSVNFVGDGLRDAFDPTQTRVRA